MDAIAITNESFPDHINEIQTLRYQLGLAELSVSGIVVNAVFAQLIELQEAKKAVDLLNSKT